jgi:LysR family transcriptional regulator of beta-lactamase
MVSAAIAGHGVALAPPIMFGPALTAERLVQPFPIELAIGHYWLTRLLSRRETNAMRAFRDWLMGAAAGTQTS